MSHLARRSAAGARQALLVSTLLTALPVAGAAAASLGIERDFGPNVTIFTPATPVSQIASTINAVANQQVTNQFGTQRYAFLFMPGTYGSAADPLNVQVGYYTTIAGLGASPGSVVVNGSIDSYNQCSDGACNALDNFWRSVSNLTINVTGALNSLAPTNGCYDGTDFWAVSQAAPLRRVAINGTATLFDYCTSPGDSSGGFIADSAFTGSQVISGSQQQFIIRNSDIDSWSNGVWNQVFSGDRGAPAQCFPAQSSCGGPYTTLPTSPVTREAPYLTNQSGQYAVFVPSVQRDSVGTTWSASTATPGTSVPLSRFFIASPSDPVALINLALALGFDLILTPGVYDLPSPIVLPHPDTVVLGLGLPTLVPTNGTAALTADSADGVAIEGVIVQAGPVNSDTLLRLGRVAQAADANDPSGLYDVFFRVGGAAPGNATRSLVVDADNAIIDDVWAWRADHGAGVGWTDNTAATGLVVNGNDVTAYGLAVEHYQQAEVLWRGQGGTDIFFQNENPYDPPSQAAWMESPTVDGWPAFKIADGVTSFRGYGMGAYSNFTAGPAIYSSHAFEVPATLPPGSLNDLLTVFLSTASFGGIQHVINGTGGSATIANPDVPVTVTSFP